MGDVKMNFKEMGQKGVGYVYLVRNGDKRRAIVSTVINFQILQNSGNFFTSCGTTSFSIATVLHADSL